ncbi:MAG: glycerol-3-phosphate 1-O-acyltransferase PlsY [Bacteroidetes bacterium]|nr:glycerol-3-phosphate 1-O-acyltransferase PlsY [Bacteroidota bacterium]
MINIHTIAAIFIAYLAGSIPTSVWVGRLFYGVDIRDHGSGNAGGTNTIRVLGVKAGIPVIVIDVFKGWFAVFLSHFFHEGITTTEQLVTFEIILGSAAVLGHVFPIFAGFRGGKGVATLLGVGIALYPWASLITAVVFVTVFLLTRWVSLSSISAALMFPVIEIIILGHHDYLSLMLLSIAVGIFIPLSHRKNIKRLLRKEEPKFRFKKQDTS